MNISKMRKLKKWILVEPRRYRQTLWLASALTLKKLDVPEEELPPCGTAGCLAGATCMMEGYKPDKPLSDELYANIVVKGGAIGNVSVIASEILGLRESEREKLFVGDCEGWLNRNKAAYNAATTPLGRAKAAAAQLDYLIAKELRRRASRRKAARA